ncbi:hypothetical protein AK88_03007 [Plasmodium fragile]|uniref:PNPLA domain-containing protein n=1 Tax=Plasmodium fragile TaxID=5857 RepID=A0A0D9QKK4_PLAFR|nr:uncharacterized protein AK88_03007 [Plasmodium fragile]KJP87327.1 hypothetical protein AK88_03007 [Plasmodium fragile]
MGNSNRRETNKKDDEEEDDIGKGSGQESGGDPKGRTGEVEVKSRGLLDESLVNIFYYENYFKNFFNLQEINKFGFTANSAKVGCEVEGDGEDKEGTSEENGKIRNKKMIEEMTFHNNKYIVNFLDDTIKSKIEIANFISFYFFFQSVRQKCVSDSIRRKDLSDVNYIYGQVRKSKRYIGSDDVETCMRNYLYHIDRRKFPIWKEPVGGEGSARNDALANVGGGCGEEVGRTSDVGNAESLEEVEPRSREKGRLSEVKKGQSGKREEEGCPSKWKKKVPQRVKIEDDKVTLRWKSTLGRKYDEGFSLYSSGRNYRRGRRKGVEGVKRRREDGEEREEEAYLGGDVDSAQLRGEKEEPGNGLDSTLKSEMGQVKNDNSSYAVYIKKTLSKVFNRYEINRYGLVRKKKGSLLLGHLLKEKKEQMNLGISFSPAGLLIPYHLGVSSLLIEKNILNIHTSIAGSSAGSICACCLGIGLSVDKCFFLIENIISNVYKNGCYQKLQNVLDVELNKYLYTGSYNFLNQRNGSVFVGITQILPYYKRLNITKFYDDRDLISAVIASCNIPMYLSNNIFANFRNKKCIDGLFSTRKKEFGCPSTKTERTVKVSPFDSDYVGIENKTNSVISPHMVKYRHLIFLFLCVKNLFHRVVDNVWVEKDYAFLVRRLKRIMDLRIFSWGEFLRDYFCAPGGGAAMRGVSMDADPGRGDLGGGSTDISYEASPSELMHRLEERLSRFRCTCGNDAAREVFLKVNREAFAQFERHNCKYFNFYSFSMTLINVMSAYFEENFFPSKRLKEVVLRGLRQDGGDTLGEEDGEDAQLENIFLMLEKKKLLRMEEYIRFHPKLESEVILFFFKEHFANDNIARLEKRFLKRSIHQLVDSLKDICLFDCVERCVQRLILLCHEVEKGRGDGRLVLSGAKGESPGGHFQSRVRGITHYLKHSQIYKNFIYILNEIKAANGRVVKVTEHNYYSFMCLNAEDMGDSYLFLYLYLYANLCHRDVFARVGGVSRVSGVRGGDNRVRGAVTSCPRGRIPPLTEGNSCGEAAPWGYTHVGDGQLAKHMVQEGPSMTNASQDARTVSLTQRFAELWTVRKRNGEADEEEQAVEQNKNHKMKQCNHISHANHVNLFMKKEDQMDVGSSCTHYVRRTNSETGNKLGDQKVGEMCPEAQLNCGHKCQLGKGFPRGLNNLLLFNHDCGVINNPDVFVKTNWNKIVTMNDQRRSEICSHLHEMDKLYRDMLFLQRFVFSINFSEQTKYKFFRKGSDNGAAEGAAKTAGVEETPWESPTKEKITGQMSPTKEKVRTRVCNRDGGEGHQRTICTSIEEMFVYGSMQRGVSSVNQVDTEGNDRTVMGGRGKVPPTSEEEDWTRRRNGSDVLPERRSTKERRAEMMMHDGSPENFVEDVETNIDKKLYNNDRTYFIKNVFSMRKLLKMAFEGANDKMIRKIYDMGRSDTYLWLYTEYLNVCIFCFKKVYLLYVKLVSVFESLLGITSLSKRRKKRKHDVSAILSSVEKFVLYVNGRALNMFELCNFVYVCVGGGEGASGRAGADVVEQVTRDAIGGKRSSPCAVHTERWGEGKQVESEGAKRETKEEATEERPNEENASNASLAKCERQHVHEGTPVQDPSPHRHLEDAEVCSGHHLSRKGKRGIGRFKRKGKGKGTESEKIIKPSGEEKENVPHQISNTRKVIRDSHPSRVSKTKQKKGIEKGVKERKQRSISVPVDLHKTVLKMHHLKGKIKLNKNIIDGINKEILTGSPYEHIYTHSNFWIYSSSDESDGKNLCGNGFYLNSADVAGSSFDSVFDDLSDEADGFSKISNFFRTFRNMDGNLGLSGYFGF